LLILLQRLPSLAAAHLGLVGECAIFLQTGMAMIDDQKASRLTQILRLLRWPAVVVLALVLFQTPLANLIKNISDLTVRHDDKGWELRFKVAALIADASRTETGEREGAGAKNSQNFPRTADVVEKSTSPDALRTLRDATVLWVDDNPDNNAADRAALEALGVRFELSTSTEDAIKRLRDGHFRAVISDMKRGDRETAGYDLLEALKSIHPTPPLVLYAASSNPEFQAQARARGAFGETNRPSELFALVVAAIQEGPRT
jgi:CheY-like chemotaxis protein